MKSSSTTHRKKNKTAIGNVLPLDEIVSKIVALGVPGLILFFVMASTGFAGAAALTAALAAIGPGGMVAGIITLGLIGVISGGITKYGTEALAKGVIKGLLDKGESKESIIEGLKKYPLSKGLKRLITEQVQNYKE